jgi:hypothetical protein
VTSAVGKSAGISEDSTAKSYCSQTDGGLKKASKSRCGEIEASMNLALNSRHRSRRAAHRRKMPRQRRDAARQPRHRHRRLDRAGQDDATAANLPGSGRGRTGTIGITQPHRRLAREPDGPHGGAVDFQVRIVAKTRPTTLVKFMTDSIRLNEI